MIIFSNILSNFSKIEDKYLSLGRITLIAFKSQAANTGGRPGQGGPGGGGQPGQGGPGGQPGQGGRPGGR